MDKKLDRECVILLLSTLVLWLVFCWQGVVTAFDIWWGNEIFNHCLFVLPTTAYLIYIKRDSLLSNDIKPTLLPLFVVVPLCTLYVIGRVGDIQLFMHIAAFTLLPVLIWSVIGHKAAKSILFPLVFLLFAIPVGEQLIPFLQEITADGSVALLKMVGIPLYRNGLYIEIPAGRFLVAEACSGVSFFIVSIVIGSLFSYLSFVSSTKKFVFVTISVFLPVLANIVRVFGIIYIAHKTDMEYAAGADHLIYGWFFFAFVILCLLGIGELLRDKGTQAEPPSKLGLGNILLNTKKVALVYLVLVVFGAWSWSYALYKTGNSTSTFNTKAIAGLKGCNDERLYWQPKIEHADKQIRRQYILGGRCQAILVQAEFHSFDSELVSGLTLLYSESEWSLMRSASETITINDYAQTVPVLYLTSPSEQKIKVARWYEVNGIVLTSTVKTKLYVTYLKMTRQYKGGRLLMLAMPTILDSAEFQVTENYE
ncbi:EpsH [Alteromonas macleodii]|uniref:exosortase A n=1 Tax=Alteromonas sp. BZK5 TaxID=1904459 RepID=UPI001653889E|nr:exosortase A [Alteromonas sp. BZK5]MBC6985314.1 exosortase [Alteromonas sp. BZK5]|tara:strand:- start:1161 stop:2603 length:1443 start_codon:yes stop_codon:yes gene_type:complete